MATISLYNYLNAALLSPLSLPTILILVNHWRFPPRVIRRAVVGLCVVLAAFNAILLLGFGLTETAGRLTGYGSPVICWSAYFVFCRFRDGRLPFTMLTTALLATIDEVILYTVSDLIGPTGLVARILLCAAQSFVLYYVCRKPFHKMLNAVSTGWLRLCVMPLTFFVCLLLAHTLPVSILKNGTWRDFALSWVLCLATVITYISIYFVINSLETQRDTEQGYALLNTQIRLTEQQTNQLLAAEKDNRAFRHDVRHFVNLMHGFLEIGDMASVEKLLRSMGARMDEISSSNALRSYTGNVMVDMVLSAAADRAERAGVQFSVRLTLPQALPVESTELAVVISNALENALKATVALGPGGHREVRIYNTLETDQFFLSVRNTFKGSVSFDSATGLPRSGEGFGYATQSIAAFAKRHNAFLSYTAKDGWFTLGILI